MDDQDELFRIYCVDCKQKSYKGIKNGLVALILVAANAPTLKRMYELFKGNLQMKLNGDEGDHIHFAIIHSNHTLKVLGDETITPEESEYEEGS